MIFCIMGRGSGIEEAERTFRSRMRDACEIVAEGLDEDSSASSKITPGESIIRNPRSIATDCRSLVHPGSAATGQT